MSSYSSATSTSSSSDSDSSSSSSSSGASFSSRSTIIAAQPDIRPFGKPEYNYFWIENKSKTKPNLSYFYNYKSHCVVWNRPIPNNVVLPVYEPKWGDEQINTTEDEDKLNVSEPEDELRKRKRLNIKKRNRRLLIEERDQSIEVVSVKRIVKSKRSLDTIWKLYRLPGETLQDVKKRMFIDTIKTPVKIKTEAISETDVDVYDYSNISIKQEPPSFEDYSFQIAEAEKTIKSTNEDFDSDQEHMNYLIKQENAQSYVDSELDSEKDEDEVPEKVPKFLQHFADDDDEETETDLEGESENDQNYIATNVCNDQFDENFYDYENMEFTYEAPYLLADLFDVDIYEDDKENIVLPPDDSMNDCSLEQESINWSFEKTASTENSFLTHEVLNPLYNSPKLKDISNSAFRSKKRKRRNQPVKNSRKRICKTTIKTEPKIKSEPLYNDQPIICDMYGVRTINYNNPPTIKLPKWQSSSKLSSSEEDSGYELDASKIKQEKPDTSGPIAPGKKNEASSALELKNWFPKSKSVKRKRRGRKNSESSWYESDLSDYTDAEDFERALIGMKKEKASRRENEENAPKSSYVITPVKQEPSADGSWNADEFKFIIKKEKPATKIAVSMTPPPMLDLSIVKVERRSSDLEEDVAAKENDGNASDSSSSSCSSSCSCSSSSSTSSSSSDEETDDKENVLTANA